MHTFKIRHTVVFNLIHPKGSPKEKEFLNKTIQLGSIPGVFNFESLREISPKNNFDFGLSMEFETTEVYLAYQKDPIHDHFVQTYWLKEVKNFLEVDFEQLLET